MPPPFHEPGSSTSGNFMNKPARGWLHPDQLITKKGVTYAVRYIGCLEVNTSMKLLDFDTRFQIAKECINRVCEAAGLKTVDKKRKIEKRVVRAIGDQPIMEYAGSNVKLSISSTSLSVCTMAQNHVVATHDMPRISFASGGDSATLDFVAYVAKDLSDWRACYVLECGGGLAQDVITTIGQAFELRFKQFLTKPIAVPSLTRSDERDYYNDLPGKVPPDVGPPPVPPLPSLPTSTSTSNTNGTTQQPIAAIPPPQKQAPSTRERLPSNNLIDLNCEVAPPPSLPRTHEYVNDVVVRQSRDVFDMQPFDESEILGGVKLQDEIWYHGCISRQTAEAALKNDGDFLVRESHGAPGQYVLTGYQGGTIKHLLLIDPEGVVRTKGRMFESVSHLVNYHCQNQVPILSAESALILRNPVPKSATVQ